MTILISLSLWRIILNVFALIHSGLGPDFKKEARLFLNCIFVTDLHGRQERYQKLFDIIEREHPETLFMGGDLLPHGSRISAASRAGGGDFLNDFLAPNFCTIKERLGADFPRVFIILGNDDARSHEVDLIRWADQGIWEYMHFRKAGLGAYRVFGYACVPPSPFRLKDWERFDISASIKPGCLPFEEGIRTVENAEGDQLNTTIERDLSGFVDEGHLHHAIFLFHSPPSQTMLDRIAARGANPGLCSEALNIGSVAIRQFIERCQPLLSLHGHIHESPRLTGAWRDQIGKTRMFSAAHDGPELAIVRFNLGKLDEASRELI